MARPELPLPAARSAIAKLGADLRDRRHRSGRSQTELAALAGCSPATIGQVERGRFTPSAQLLADWEAALGDARSSRALWELAVLAAHAHRSAVR